MSEEIIIDIDPSGDTTIEVKGYSGPGCKALTADIERALGKATSDRLTSEYHQSEQRREVGR